MPALGEEFRSAREARGLTLSDVAEQIHIRSVYLNAIENEDWKSIGAPVYVRGFIRTYARFLGLDAEDAVANFNRIAPPERAPAQTASTAIVDEREGSPVSIWAIIGTLVALVIVGFVLYEAWLLYSGRGNGSAPVVATTAQPAAATPGSQSPAPGASASPSPSGSPAPAARHQLAVRLTQRSWLRVSVDGKTLLEGIYPAGTARTFTGGVADLRVGNAGGVLVSVNGRPAAPLGKDGDVVEQRYTL
ncbi:MAG TPA: RodZ domain-containing protein [Candidatus Elarobacter sp.]|jgi:cytoskeletal protein RodZ|nr:RodZ domain-containing protein [Candidatus Elarobacter sp.]